MALICGCAEDPYFSVSPMYLEFPAEGGDAMININSNVEWNCTASNYDLINVPFTNGFGNMGSTLIASPNPNPNQWKTVLTFSYMDGETYMYAGEVHITIAPNNGNSNNNNDNNNYNVTAPTGLTAKSSTNGIQLTWNSVSGSQSYKYYRSTSQYGLYSYCGQTYNTSVTDTEVTSGNTYYYKVTAIGTNNIESSYSNIAYAKYEANSSGQTSQIPSAPTGLSAYWDGPAAYPYVILSWSSVSSATNYSVYRATSASGYYSKIGDSSSRTYSDNNVSIGKTYYYKVKASNSAGTSDYSSYTSVTLEDTRKPGPVTYGYCSATSTTITLKWQIPTDNSYGKPTKIVLRLYDPTYNVWVDAQELSGTTTSVSFPFGMWVDSDGYVKCGVIPYNEHGSGGGSAKVYDTKNKKWLM